MSTSPLSAPLDLRSLVRSGAVYERTLDPGLFPRLAEAVASGVEAVEVSLTFREGRRGRPVIAGHALARVGVICQHCLEPFTIAVETDVRLQVVADAEALAELPEDEDAVVGDESAFDVATVIEDELLLALPMVARHEQACAAPANPAATALDETTLDQRALDQQAGDEAATHRPFADLAGQWRKQDNQSGDRNE